MMPTFQRLEKAAGSSRGRRYIASVAMTDQTFLMKYCDNDSPRFDGSVYVINCSSVVEHKGVDVQGVTVADLREGDDIVYKHTYKHGRTRLWKGVVVRTAGDTGHVQMESPPSSETDCVSVASGGSYSEARSSKIAPGSNGKRSRKRKPRPKEAQNPLPKKKAKIGNILNVGVGEKGGLGEEVIPMSGGCPPQSFATLTSMVPTEQSSKRNGGGCPPTTSMSTERCDSPLIAGVPTYPLSTYSPRRTPVYLDQVSIHEGVILREELRRYQDDMRRNQDDMRFNMSDFQKSVRNYMDKIDRQLTEHHAAQLELFQHNQQLQRKQDQLAIKQDQLYKLIAGERGIGSPPHIPVIFPSPSARPSPGFSRRSSISPSPVFAKSLSPSYNMPPPSPSVTTCSEYSAGPLKLDQATPSREGTSDLQSVCESLMSELDFDFTPFLDEPTPTIGAATADSIVFTAPICSESSIQSLPIPSGGCLPGNDSCSSLAARPVPSGGYLPGNDSSSSLAAMTSVPHFRPEALPLPSILSSGGCLSGIQDDGNLKAAVVSISPSNSQHETLVVNPAVTRGSTSPPHLGAFKSPEQVVQENRGLCTTQGAGQLATALARQSYFGVHTLLSSSMTGKSGPALDQTKLAKMEEFLQKSVFFSLSDSEFKKLWKFCKISISTHIKHERQKLKKRSEQ